MKPQNFVLLLLLVTMISAIAKPALCQQEKASSVLVERVGDTAFLQLHAPSFQALSPREQALAYWLTQASIAIDPVIYDQLSAYGLQQKRLLEEIMAHPKGIDPAALAKIAEFTKLFWANRGNHNDTTSQKFLPAFTFEELEKAALRAQQNGAYRTAYADLPPLKKPADVTHELESLRPSLFDPAFEPMMIAKSPVGGKDTIQASSNTFYPGLSLNDLQGFQDQYPLNSRVVKAADGKLTELVYRAGTPDGKVPPGLYARFLKKANDCFEKARRYADPAQAEAIAHLIRYYQTGDYADWVAFGTTWVQNDATVDFDNGFIEVYRDARGAKGSSQSFVTITDKPVTTLMKKLGANAAYFEQKAPWDDKYKLTSFKLPVVKAVETLIETGDFNVTTIGDNLPNENEIHEKYGSKNFLFTGSKRALDDATGKTAAAEFAVGPAEVERDAKYGSEAQDLMTALHEVIGHGSGKLSERVKGGAQPLLKEYFSTLEEGRADLMALWNVWDPKLKELGLISNQEEVAKAMYDNAAAVALLQLRRIPRGDTVEEDHQRDRQLIAQYIADKVPGSIEQFTRDGKTYVRVADYQKMRQGVGMLLAELMRIKAEGDYDAIKALVDKYGVHFDPALRDQILARYKKLNLPTYFAGINAHLTASLGKNGEVEKVEIHYWDNPVAQYLNYGAMYDKGLTQAMK
ncbi:MAG: dipeptidyl peptidase 3 [Acidobacteriia bacterium]|nr:dipeptidyl peptidase 3 [Terriglobia bacterium]